MKRTIWITSCMLAALCLLQLPAGCSKKETPEEQPAASGPAATTAPATPIDPATAASVSGTVTFVGTAPKPAAIDMSQDPNCKGSNKPKTLWSATVISPTSSST